MSTEEFSESDVLAALNDFIVEVDDEPRLEVDVDGRRHTVELRPVYEFEREILFDLIEPRGATSVSGAAIPVKGRWIHGWLDLKEEDYINNIWKNYQFFLKYLEAESSKVENAGTIRRTPGTYNTMYRFLIILEDLGLLERFRRETVPQDEYDFPVPEEFRTRTFIRLTSDYESNKDEWDNPYEALYPGGEKSEEEGVEPEEEIPEEIRGIAPVDREEEPEEPEEPKEGEEIEVEPSLEGFTGEEVEETELPEENASIADFPEREEIIELADLSFPETMQRTFEEAPIVIEEADPEDFGLGRIAVVGFWATGDATPGRTNLRLVVSVDDSFAPVSPGFVPAGVQEHLGDVMTENNPYPDIFPNYIVFSSYNSAFLRLVDEVVRRDQEELVYYSLDDMEFKELS